MSEWSINIQIPFDTIRWVSSQWTAVHTEPPHGRCWLTYALSCVHKSSIGETLVYQAPSLTLQESEKVAADLIKVTDQSDPAVLFSPSS